MRERTCPPRTTQAEKEGLPFSLYPLDPNFVAPKPKNSVEDASILALEKAGHLIITVKRNGYRHHAVKAEGIRIYTRGGEEVTDRYPHIVEELSRLNIPEHTMLDGEIVVQKDGKDSLAAVTQVAKLSACASVSLQKEQGYANFFVFDAVVYAGEATIRLPYERRRRLYEKLLPGLHSQFVFSVQILDCSFTRAQEMVNEKGWEGLVLYDKRKGSDFRTDGNTARPMRPDGCWKRKPEYEDDFIAYKWVHGAKGKKHADRLGKMYLRQIDSNTGKFIECGEVGIGFSDNQRKQYANDSLYPIVVELQFKDRFPSKKLQFPSFVRVRDDKRPEECVYSEE